jgi:hypothetical protein
MFCDRCGAKLEESQNFCPACGKGLRALSQIPAQSRIGGHVRLLGILWLAISAVRLIPGFVIVVIFGSNLSFLPPEVPSFVPGLIHTIGLGLLATAILGIATGWGLLAWQPWARMVAIIFGCFSLLDVPFGTALGIYTLWVLLPAKSEEEYKQRSAAAAA